MKNMTNTGKVTGESLNVGGNVGLNIGNEGIIRKGENISNVEGEGHVGGNIGLNEGVLEDMTNEGEVGGRQVVGGNVGLNLGSLEGMTNEGEVEGEEKVGGNVGENYRIVNEEELINTGTVNGESADIAKKIGYKE